MKNVETKWSVEEVKQLTMTRGPTVGIVAVLVSEKLGSDYSAYVSCGGSTPSDALEKLIGELPPTIGVYAILPSSNPEDVVEQMNFPWIDEMLGAKPYTVKCDGIDFHKATPDHGLCDMRTSAWERLAEQNLVSIVERWGEKVTP